MLARYNVKKMKLRRRKNVIYQTYLYADLWKSRDFNKNDIRYRFAPKNPLSASVFVEAAMLYCTMHTPLIIQAWKRDFKKKLKLHILGGGISN